MGITIELSDLSTTSDVNIGRKDQGNLGISELILAQTSDDNILLFVVRVQQNIWIKYAPQQSGAATKSPSSAKTPPICKSKEVITYPKIAP
ncbi:unnamed protein product [Fasciola hepatica]|uniref:Uncharacterized protein n=1 Tax=Fasciola hepatica TaxID=6192 RepID=A0ABC9HGC5_FASHE